MRTLQREPCRRVVKLSIRPEHSVVAGRTHGGRKPGGNVVWHNTAKCRSAIPRRLVAAVTIRVRGGKGVIVADVAIRAGHDFACRRQLMRPGQRPSGRGVIENRRGPCNGVVAGGAIGCCKWRSGTRVHRIIRPVVRRQVTLGIPAIRRLNGQRRIVPHVALVATRNFAGWRNLVRIRQWESRRRVVEG